MRPLAPPHRLLAALCLLLLPPCAVAEVADDIAPLPWSSEVEAPLCAAPAEAPMAAGFQAFLDPITGELTDTPTDKQRQALEATGLSPLNQSSEGLETFSLAGGGSGVNLQGRFRSALVVHRAADGSLEVRCLDHPDQAPGHTHEGNSQETSPAPEM